MDRKIRQTIRPKRAKKRMCLTGCAGCAKRRRAPSGRGCRASRKTSGRTNFLSRGFLWRLCTDGSVCRCRSISCRLRRWRPSSTGRGNSSGSCGRTPTSYILSSRRKSATGSCLGQRLQKLPLLRFPRRSICIISRLRPPSREPFGGSGSKQKLCRRRANRLALCRRIPPPKRASGGFFYRRGLSRIFCSGRRLCGGSTLSF